MNIIFLSIAFLVSLTFAEPPVDNGYPAARSSDHHHDDHHDHHDHTADHQRSLSQEYGTPSVARNAIPNEYDSTNARNSPNSRGQAHKHAAPTGRASFNQRFSSAASRSSTNGHNSANSINQGYDAPNARSGVSQEYGPPESRSLSQEYGVPSATARSLSTEYGVPARSPSAEYGVPQTRSEQKHLSNFRRLNSLSENYSAPKSQFQTDSQSASQSDYSPSLARSNNAGYDAPNSYSKPSDTQSVSHTHGTPKNAPSSTYGAPSRSLSTSYGAPARNSDSSSQDYNSISQSYTAPNERDLSETYGTPNARSMSQKNEVSSIRSNLKADAGVTSYSPTRSSSSSSYPAARDTTPSQQYGVPEDDQGYEDSRARVLEELLNQEPANYDFAYQIEDQESGSDFGHSETRHENRAEGSYFVVLPDGTKQTVEYEADERGYRPRISYEPSSGGYDENAQDLGRSQGPY